MKKYWKELCIVIMILALILVSNYSCKLQGERNILKDQLKDEVSKVKVFKQKQKVLFDSLFAENLKKDTRISKLQKSNEEIDKNLQNSVKKLAEKKKEIANYTYIQSAETLKERYNTKSVVATNNSVNLLDSIPNLVIEDLAEMDKLNLDVEDYKTKVANKDEEIKLSNEKLLNKDIEIASKQIETDILNKSLDISTKLNKKTQNQLRTQKVLKWVYAGIGATLGILIAR